MQARLMEAPKKKKAASRDKNGWREIVRSWQKSNEHPKDFWVLLRQIVRN